MKKWKTVAAVGTVGAAWCAAGWCESEPQQAAGRAEAGAPPAIVRTVPEVGAVDVDPQTTSIAVVFDRDMAGGMSWTGGGPDFPKSPEGARAAWIDKRTCLLPVTLERGKYYRVGINSTSFQNFRSADGVPARPSAIYFTTEGASPEVTARVRVPKIVSMEPMNGSTDVDPQLKELRVTFDLPMGQGFSWTGGGSDFPKGREGSRPTWSEDRKTCTLPVELEPDREYRLGLNSPSHKNFQSESGIPLQPVLYSFRTRSR